MSVKTSHYNIVLFGVKTDTYDLYKKFGGDGFYASWVCPFNEPAISKYLRLNKVNKIKYFCPNSVQLQKKIILIKTNYRNLNEAKYQAKLFKKTIRYLELNLR